MLVLRVRMVHIPQAVVVEEQVVQGLLEAELLAVTVATLIFRVQHRAVLMVVEVGKVRGLATQVAPQNTAVEAVALGMKVRLMASMVVALFTEQVLAEVVARRTILAEMEGCGITH